MCKPHSNLQERKNHFIEKANKIHNFKYDYSKIEYISTKHKMTIICPVHGEFSQTGSDHLKGWGCSKCSRKHKLTKEEWIERANQKHDFKYNYSKVEYKDNKTPVCIICPEHGEFWQIPNNHIKGTKCPKCEGKRRNIVYAKTTEQFIEDAQKVHGDVYDYSKVNYYNKSTKVCIICSKHGEFWQGPSCHLSGSGCPQCVNKNQTILFNVLKNEFQNEIILYEYSPKWLGKKHYDIYFLNHNIAVEYDGQQHFSPIKYFGGEAKYVKVKERDLDKDRLSIRNNCYLFRIQYNYTIEQLNQLITSIKNIINNNDVELKVTYLYNH